MTDHIRIEHRDHVLTLTFARPDKKNAITNLMYGALADAIVAAETDNSVRVIVLRGEGDMFTAGNDVAEIDKIKRSLKPGGLFVVEYFHNSNDVTDGFDTGQLAKLFADGYDIVRDEVVDDVPDWGMDKATLVRFVARKR